MAQASTIAVWVMLLFKTAAVVACIIALLCLVWVIRLRLASRKKDDDLG